MSTHPHAMRPLIATIGILLSGTATAWTPYGGGPYDPGSSQPGAPGQDPGFGYGLGFPPAPPYPETFGRTPYGPDLAPGYPPPEPPAAENQTPSPDSAPQAPGYPAYGPPPGYPRSFPGYDRPRFGGPPSRFQISRETSEDAYILDIRLSGMKPEEVQVRTEGRWILISQDRSEQQAQEDSFDDGRGFTRSYSFSSGTASRRLSVPRDADLSAMTREESDDSIRILIPRRQR
ncbi:MAG: Hsp20/alpha crystallin family protein [Pseudomonadota bacterium]|nr:Hsp20/alpha crystallin family protein [Pseudomonadota bacterium]